MPNASRGPGRPRISNRTLPFGLATPRSAAADATAGSPAANSGAARAAARKSRREKPSPSSSVPALISPFPRRPVRRLPSGEAVGGAELFVHDEERAEAVEVVLVALAREVVGQVADVRPLTDIDEVGQPVGARGEFRQHAPVAFERHRLVMLVEVAALDAHPEHVHIHARTRRFEPVAGLLGLVHDLIPETRLPVLKP